MQAGSQWWFDLLLQHPSFEPRKWSERELHFFDQFCTRAMSDADVAFYHSRFPRRPGRISGEWTPRYSLDPWTPILLRRAAPEAKLLLLVTDPIERYRSTLARKLSDAKSEEELIYLADAASRGRYAAQLRRLLAFYDRENILVLQYEQCRTDPRAEYARTLSFLGLRDDFQPKRLRVLASGETPGPYRRARRFLGQVKRIGVKKSLVKVPKPDLWPDLRLSLLADLEPEVLELRSLVPTLNLALWPNFAHLAQAASRDGASRRAG